MTRIEYTAHRRRKLDQQIGDPRQYDFLLHRRGMSQLQIIRDSLGITVMDLARRMKVSHTRVRQYEAQERNGEIRLSALLKAAEVMDCQVLLAIVPKGESYSSIVERDSEAS